MRGADARPTPPVHIVVRPPALRNQLPQHAGPLGSTGGSTASSGHKQGATHSPPNTPSLPRISPQHQQHQRSEGDKSYYLEHSVEDVDLIVMRSLTDWSQGASGMSQGAPSVNGSSLDWRRESTGRMSRSLIMPQIVEAAGEQEGAQEQQDPQDQQQHAGPGTVIGEGHAVDVEEQLRRHEARQQQQEREGKKAS